MSTHFDFNITFYCLQTNFKTKEYCKIHLSLISWLATIKSISTWVVSNFVIVVTYCLSWTGDLLWQLKLRILFSAVSFISLDWCIFCHFFSVKREPEQLQQFYFKIVTVFASVTFFDEVHDRAISLMRLMTTKEEAFYYCCVVSLHIEQNCKWGTLLLSVCRWVCSSTRTGFLKKSANRQTCFLFT